MEKPVKELINESFQAIHDADLNKAWEITKVILEKEPKNPLVLEILGYILYEMNSVEEAKFCFNSSIEIDDSRSHFPYLYLAQLTSNEESVNNYLKTIELMKSFNNVDEIPDYLHPTKLDISNSYVALAEIYMTDLCDKDDAQEKCAEYIKCAIESDETNPSAWQVDAGYKVIVNNKDDATESIKKSLNLWLPSATKVVEEKRINDECTDICTDETTEIRSKCAEILYDLEMYREMRSVLETILFDDEHFFEANYLMAICLDKMMIDGSISEKDKSETVNDIFNFADNAASLADPEVESEAISKMHELMKKYEDGILKSDDESDDSDMDTSEDSGEISSTEEMAH